VVGSTYPGGGEASKGLAVRQLKSHASWVKTVNHFNPVRTTIRRLSCV